MAKQPKTIPGNASLMKNFVERAIGVWRYVSADVWADTRLRWWINVVKAMNISVKSFLNTDLQSQACAMTYRTLLAVVPALALLFAIGRGFGFQNLLQDELYLLFPAQKTAIAAALQFVDSYLNQASEGVFVGVGIVFLLWTLISLIGNVESSFNLIWGVRQGRSFVRKITDYTAMLLILPVLMICASGLLMMLNKTIIAVLGLSQLTPALKFMFEALSMMLTWLFFAMMFMLIPNTKVKFRYAMLAGAFSGTGFFILQWLFVTGQMYVSRYNAIYGSFSFLPLLLIWMQLAWVVCLAGCLICYASQNIFRYSFSSQINSISNDYREKVTIAIATLVCHEFVEGRDPVTPEQMIRLGVPTRLVGQTVDRLCAAGIISRVVIDQKHDVYGFQPAFDPRKITLSEVRIRLNRMGLDNFIPDFDHNFRSVVNLVNETNKNITNHIADVPLYEIPIHTKTTK